MEADFDPVAMAARNAAASAEAETWKGHATYWKETCIDQMCRTSDLMLELERAKAEIERLKRWAVDNPTALPELHRDLARERDVAVTSLLAYRVELLETLAPPIDKANLRVDDPVLDPRRLLDRAKAVVAELRAVSGSAHSRSFSSYGSFASVSVVIDREWLRRIDIALGNVIAQEDEKPAH